MSQQKKKQNNNPEPLSISVNSGKEENVETKKAESRRKERQD